jgi:indole-3-acetate monooxygenase
MAADRSERRDTDPAAVIADCVARARAVAPVVAEAAPRIEAARALTPDVLAALHEQRLFRLLLPAALGGDAAPPMALAQVTETIAAADASTAWCLGQGAGCAMSAAYMAPEAARRVFGPPDSVLAWGAGPEGEAVPVEGGFRATGRWMFASGSRHATWLGGHCKVIGPDGRPLHRPDGRILERTVLFPRGEARIDDIWHVMGLRGTGSDGYAIEDMVVPAALTLDRDNPAERIDAAPVYRISTTGMYSAAFAGVALGVARGMLDALTALAADKTPRAARSSLRESAVFQSELARLEAKRRSARAFLMEAAEAIWAEAVRGEEPSLERRADLRLASTWAINQGTDVVDAAWRLAGSTAIFESRAFERRFRDAHAVSQQLQGRFTHFETIGRLRLGHDDGPMFL